MINLFVVYVRNDPTQGFVINGRLVFLVCINQVTGIKSLGNDGGNWLNEQKA